MFFEVTAYYVTRTTDNEGEVVYSTLNVITSVFSDTLREGVRRLDHELQKNPSRKWYHKKWVSGGKVVQYKLVDRED